MLSADPQDVMDEAELLAILGGGDVASSSVASTLPRSHALLDRSALPHRSHAESAGSAPSLLHQSTLSSTLAVGAASSALGIQATAPRRKREGEEDTEVDQHHRKAPRLDVVQEQRSGIAISQGTAVLDQLSSIFAQYRYLPCSALPSLGGAKAGVIDPPSCTIAAVVSRSDPRIGQGKSGANVFGMLRVWSMRGLSGNASTSGGSEEISVLVCDAAFREQFRRIDVGAVVLFTKLEVMKPSGNATAQQHHQVTIRCAEVEQFRVLGFARTLKPCAAITQRSSGEQCKRMVNTAECAYCAFHTSELRKVLKSSPSGPSRPVARPLVASHTLPSGLAGGGPLSAGSVAQQITQPTLGAPRAATHTSHVAAAAQALLQRSNASAPRLFAQSNTTLHASQRLQSESFIATRGHNVVSSGAINSGSTGEGSGAAGGTYAGVVRGAAMEVTGVDRSVLSASAKKAGDPAVVKPRVPLAKLGVTHRGRDVLAAAIQRSDEETKAVSIEEAMRLRVSGHRAASAAVSSLSPPAALRHYAPLTGMSRAEEDVVMPSTHHANKIFSKRSSVVGSLASRLQRTTQALHEQRASEHGALSLAGAAAHGVESRHDTLRRDAERERLDASGQRLLEVDRAMSALDKVHEQKVRAIHCRTCNRFFYSKPQDCAAQGHNLASVQTSKKFFSCDHCALKISVLGDLSPSLLVPTCHRCKHTAIWNVASAAPSHYHLDPKRYVEGDGENVREES